MMAMFNIGARAQVVTCRGTGGSKCVLQVAIANGSAAGTDSPAA
jgi:hypothetical protein